MTPKWRRLQRVVGSRFWRPKLRLRSDLKIKRGAVLSRDLRGGLVLASGWERLTEAGFRLATNARNLGFDSSSYFADVSSAVLIPSVAITRTSAGPAGKSAGTT